MLPLPITTQAQEPIHSPHKLIESIIIQYWLSLQIHYFHHSCIHPSLSKLHKPTICSFPTESFLFSSKSVKYHASSYLIHPFTNISMISNPHFPRHLFYDININTTQKPALLTAKSRAFFSPTTHRTHHTNPYYTT